MSIIATVIYPSGATLARIQKKGRLVYAARGESGAIALYVRYASREDMDKHLAADLASYGETRPARVVVTS
jgi:hypothetical protein